MAKIVIRRSRLDDFFDAFFAGLHAVEDDPAADVVLLWPDEAILLEANDDLPPGANIWFEYGMDDDLRERLADLSHEIWSHWMRWMFSCGADMVVAAEGEEMIAWTMPPSKRERWQRQMNTPYGELSEREKDSDREQADKILDVLGVQDSDKTADLWCSECNLRTDICQCPDWSNLPPGAVHVAGAVRDASD